ncbi:hypothetical protein GCM10010195_58750 [Kitasatospora griseola]|nr:hypothetical protein GCM10010195_58750 [Kitasatospora griseola]
MRRWWAVRPGEVGFLVVGLPAAVLGGACALAALYAGVLLSLTVVGLPVAALALAGARRLGAPQRWLTGRMLGENVPAPGPAARPDGAVARIGAALADTVAWRTLGHLLLRLPLGVLGLAVVLLPLGCGWLLGFPLWLRLLEDGPHPATLLDVAAPLLGLVLLALTPPLLRLAADANRYLARHLLGPARTQQRVEDLEAARHTLLTTGAERLRRLERDLYDGTQARLVALAITLSLADDTLTDRTDPRLRTLLDRARTQTDDTIAELRTLTQGLRPTGLDGGLAEALPALAAGCAVPVTRRRPARAAGRGGRTGPLVLRRRAAHQHQQAQRRERRPTHRHHRRRPDPPHRPRRRPRRRERGPRPRPARPRRTPRRRRRNTADQQPAGRSDRRHGRTAGSTVRVSKEVRCYVDLLCSGRKESGWTSPPCTAASSTRSSRACGRTGGSWAWRSPDRSWQETATSTRTWTWCWPSTTRRTTRSCGNGWR